MTEIQVKIENAQACAVKTGELTAGMVGLPVSFVFGPEWDGLSITAVFQGSGQVKDQVLLNGTETTVPHEVMTAAGSMLRIGAEGRNSEGDLVIPSTMAAAGIIQPGADPSGDVSTDPTLTVWQQIIGLIGNMEDLTAEDAKTLVEAINAAAKSGVGAVIYVQPDEPEGAPVGALWLDTDEDNAESTSESIPLPETAEVGQTVIVTEVDETGKPTGWAAADFPSGGTGTWKKLAEVTLEEAVFNAEVTITEDISEVIFVITQLGGDTAAQVMAVRAWGCDTNVFLLGGTSTSTSNQRATVRLRKITLGDGSAYVDFLNYVYSASASQGTTGSAMAGNKLIEAKGSTFGIKKVAAGNTLPVGFSYYILGR